MRVNHVLVQTNDLQAMTGFLKRVTGLEEGYRPPFPFPGTWIYSEGKPLLHLVETAANGARDEYLGSAVAGAGPGAVDHIALEGADYGDLIERLTRFGLPYSERTVPLTREHQVFVEGPDGIKLEMIFNERKGDLVEQ